MGNFIKKGLFPLLILAVGLGAGVWFFANPEKAQKRERPEAPALLVETGTAESGTYTAEIEAMGQVMPATETTLKPQVSGEILEVADEFIPGGFFEKDQVILKIDPEDYRLEVQKQEAILKQAEADYKLELGRQDVAKDELDILARTTGKKLENPSLALRAPQMAQAKAELEKVQADLDAAKLALRRTEIKAPFNALVTSRQATLGDKISPSDTLATLVSTDEYWIEISVPVNDLQWLDIPRGEKVKGSAARIVMDGARGERTGHLLKLTGTLDGQSRLATVLVSVPDPLSLRSDSESVPLILTDYVKVVLEGRTMRNVTRVPLSWLRDGNIVWVNDGGELAFRPAEIVYEDREYAYIKTGISPEDVVVTSDIAVPVERMKLRTTAEARQDVQNKMKGPKGPTNGETP